MPGRPAVPLITPGNMAEVAGLSRCVPRETGKKKMRNVPREKRFEEGKATGEKGTVWGRKGEKPFKSAMASLVPTERQLQAEERGRRQVAGEAFFLLLPLVGLPVWPH